MVLAASNMASLLGRAFTEVSELLASAAGGGLQARASARGWPHTGEPPRMSGGRSPREAPH
eukprot:2984622-Prymnesium_polylepis.1